MKIHELRKIASKNKKYKYIYQLIVDGEIVLVRRSNKEYLGVCFEEIKEVTRYHWFQSPGAAGIMVKHGPKDVTALALTFDELLKFTNLGV